MARNYEDFIEAYLEFTSGHEATPKVHKWSIIAAIAASLERKIWLDRAYYILFPNLYTFIIGRSGLVKKSTSTGIAVNMLRDLPGFRMMSDRLTASALIEQLKIAGKTFEVEGKEIRQSPLFAYASELSVFLEEVWGNITTLLTTFYDCQPNDSTKPWVYNTKMHGDTKIYGPCLNILGASTKAWLQKCIPTAEMEAGFTSRILFVVENAAPERLVAWPEFNDNTAIMRLKLIADLQHIYSNLRGPIKVDLLAKKCFSDWYHFHVREVIPLNSDPRISGYMGRKGDLILKLAILRMVSLTDKLCLEKHHIEWAGAELEELEPDMRNAFDYGGDKPGALSFEIRNFIKNRVKVKVEDVLKVFNTKAPGNEIKMALQDLIEMEEIVEVMMEKIPHFVFTGSDINLISRMPQTDSHEPPTTFD